MNGTAEILLYIRNTTHAKKYFWPFGGHHRYVVIEETEIEKDDYTIMNLMFTSDVLEELKVWMDCNAMKIIERRIDSADNKDYNDEFGIMHTYVIERK